MRKNHVLLEVRDARIPFSSENQALADLTRGFPNKTHLVVLNKTDLSDPRRQPGVLRQLKKQGVTAIFTSAAKAAKTVQSVLELIKRAPGSKFKTVPTGVLVVGVPNVGKSSLINAFRTMARKTAVVSVGALPGHTKRIGGFMVCDEPRVFVVDTPGIMLPRFEAGEPGLEKALKLVLTGAIKDSVVGIGVVARYLLYCLNRLKDHRYTRILDCPQTRDIDVVLLAVAKKIGGVDKQPTTPDLDRAAHYFVSLYRDGKLGYFTLD